MLKTYFNRFAKVVKYTVRSSGFRALVNALINCEIYVGEIRAVYFTIRKCVRKYS
jgi:hypothetical protein